LWGRIFEGRGKFISLLKIKYLIPRSKFGFSADESPRGMVPNCTAKIEKQHQVILNAKLKRS